MKIDLVRKRLIHWIQLQDELPSKKRKKLQDEL